MTPLFRMGRGVFSSYRNSPFLFNENSAYWGKRPFTIPNMSKKLEEDRDETAESVPEKKAKAKQGASAADASDLRALLLILVLTVIVFFILLYKQKHPEEYAKSVVQAKEGADAAYSKAGEILPEAYRGLDGFFKYVADYGKGSELPPELPKADIGALSSSVGSGTTSELSDETESGSGTEALS